MHISTEKAVARRATPSVRLLETIAVVVSEKTRMSAVSTVLYGNWSRKSGDRQR